MKYQSLSFAISALAVKAQETSTTGKWQSVAGEILKNTKALDQRLRGALVEPVSETGTNVNFLNTYGCWCNFENYKLGRGQPRDVYDRACKRLHDNYLCIETDFSQNGNLCIAADQEYVTDYLSLYILQAVQTNMYSSDLTKLENQISRFQNYCRDKNTGNPCAIETCIAESTFLYDIFPDLLFATGLENYDSTLSHVENSSFNYDTDCPNVSGSTEEPVCCGATPDRVRYRASSKSCCEASGSVFNPMYFCCGVNGVDTIGNC